MERQPAVGRAQREHLGHLLDLRHQLEAFVVQREAARLGARDIEQVVDQPEQVRAGELDQLDLARDAGIA